MNRKVDKAKSRTEVWVLIALSFSAPLLLLFCLYLKQQELISERSHIPRIALTVMVVLVLIVTFVSLWIPVLKKILNYFRLQYDHSGKLSSGNILFGAGTLIIFIPLIALLAWFSTRNEKMELEALLSRGVIARKCITRYEYTRGSSRRNSYRYKYSFPVRSSGNNTYILSIWRRHYTLKPGDSVDIIYLPVDPEIFHEVTYRSGKPFMIRYR